MGMARRQFGRIRESSVSRGVIRTGLKGTVFRKTLPEFSAERGSRQFGFPVPCKDDEWICFQRGIVSTSSALLTA
ncbi:hypothetical protein C1I88_03780 [Akkermansia muciniphila]|nr:hypothetical protein C1I88_03780 [Akkermansia muciniphila]